MIPLSKYTKNRFAQGVKLFHGKEKENDRPEERNGTQKKWKRRIIGGITAAGVGFSLLLTGMFGSAEEILQQKTQTITRQQNPVVIMMDAEEPDTEEEEENGNQEEEDEKGIFAKMRKWILRLPAGVRALVVVPLWCAGFGLIQGFGVLWQAVSAPVAGMILKWVLTALLIVAVYAATVKSIFPHMPLKNILRPKNILYLLAGTAILAGVDRFLLLFWKDYPVIRSWILFLGGLSILVIVGVPFIRRHHSKAQAHTQRRQKTQQPEYPETADVYILPEGEKLIFPSNLPLQDLKH